MGLCQKGLPKYEAEIIVAEGNFHGRTTTIVSFSTENFYREMFGPFTPGFKIVPYGDLEALKAAITPNTAAVMLEPIQGENGVIVPPDGYLKGVSEACKENKFSLSGNQTDFAAQANGSLATGQSNPTNYISQALSGGMYQSAVLASADLLGLFEPGAWFHLWWQPHSSPNRLTLEVLEEEKLDQRATELGEYFMAELRKIETPIVKEVRGRGLLIGVELFPEAGGARRYCEMLREKGLLAKETHDHVVRFAPPLVIEKADLDWALGVIAEVLKS